ncbi:MAG: PhnD/SsuA/transferrin family substrate-binding protein [Nitrospirae bacterium]|nr:PhnD/SsuA/transferrin family substrate-binding protein [Nitrospirota bacterium]
MNAKKLLGIFLIVATGICFTYSFSQAEEFKIAIMQDQKGAAQQYRPLVDFMKKKGVDVSFVGTSNYTEAAKMFEDGKADAMFSGSGVAGSMVIKGVAYPVVRPAGNDGNSTYWAVILAPKGTPKYTGSGDYFKGKKVIFCSLASSGEFYFHAVGGHKAAAKMMNAASHGAAIDALSKGTADLAIVKNRVWDKMKSKYPELEIVGEDDGENPDGTLIVSKKVSPPLAEKVKSALLSLKGDASAEAKAVRDGMSIQGYIDTTEKDFTHTVALLKQAGVDKSFDFSF